MRLNVEMTLNAGTAQRLRETAERLAAMNLGEDGLIAATVLMRIAKNYQTAVDKILADGLEQEDSGRPVAGAGKTRP
jgi:hypothetical protein